MFDSAEDAAVSAVLSLLLEVSANPKPGNVDREHNFNDLRYEHFLASSSASFPVFLRIAMGEIGIGEGILELVRVTKKFHTAENVHFGAFLLLTPLVSAWGDVKKAYEIVKNTGYGDSIAVKKAFDISKARVVNAEEMDLKDNDLESKLVEKRINLYTWMKLAPDENFIAKEYVNGFSLSKKGKEKLLKYWDLLGDVNKTVVLCYVSLLSELHDPLIIAKKGFEVAETVREMARESLELYNATENFAVFDELDRKILNMGVNPGSVADLVVSSIYLAFSEGWRF